SSATSLAVPGGGRQTDGRSVRLAGMMSENPERRVLMKRILLGAVAGLAATVPMTLAMKLMHEQLPGEEQYPLPPRQVTEGMAEKAGLGEHLDEEERAAATWVSHFAYGAACGALYGAVSGDRLDTLA